MADYCLPLEYNALELPSSERLDVQINLEVRILAISVSLFFVELRTIFF